MRSIAFCIDAPSDDATETVPSSSISIVQPVSSTSARITLHRVR